MTDYEELSLGLLSSVAQGINLQLARADILTPLKELPAAERVELVKQFGSAQTAWRKTLAAFSKRAYKSDPGRYE